MNQNLAAKNTQLEVSSANKLFIQKDFKILDSFLEMSQNVFNVSQKSLDFTKTETAMKEINDWVSEATRNKIRKIFQNIDPMTKLVVANAVYFKVD